MNELQDNQITHLFLDDWALNSEAGVNFPGYISYTDNKIKEWKFLMKYKMEKTINCP